ncbi:MAG: hypothetical protein ABIR32_13965 [Ilumatobacteraceae bacterium]
MASHRAVDVVLDVVVFSAGAIIVVATLLSAIRTVVLPHGRTAKLTRVLFSGVRRVLVAHRRIPGLGQRRHEVMSLYAPLTLVCLPLVWILGAFIGSTAMFWGLGTRPFRNAFKTAGSSMLTLGFSNVDDYPRMILAFGIAALTISVLALLLVTYLPTMYQAYSSRETILTALETYAGEPPDPVELLVRHRRIGADDHLREVWREWRDWFFESRETHTALPPVVLFRSSSAEREWVQAVEALLDAAALWNAVCIDVEDPDASLCLRAGSMTLNDIAAAFGLESITRAAPDDPISTTRDHFDTMYDRLAEDGLVVIGDRDAAWRAWAGWRVNYDVAIIGLTRLTSITD